ncbi:MAG: HD domain-containing protein [Oscillochloris sp.]|nr:HD domain-containing protein [Oscillochloris sp.]
MAHDGSDEYTTVLAKLITRLNADLEPQALLQIVCNEVALAFSALATSVGVYDEQQRIIRYRAATGHDLQSLAQLIPDPSSPASPQPYSYLTEQGMATLVGLWREERPVGALAIILPADQANLSDGQICLLRILADLVAQAVVNAIRLTSARTRADDLETINKLGRALAETLDLDRIFELLYEVALELLPDVAGAIFSLFDAEKQQIICTFAVLDGQQLDPSGFPALPLAAVGRGIQSTVIHTRQPVIVGALEEIYQRAKDLVYVGDSGNITESALFVPMIARERVVGVLQVQSFTLGCFSMSHAAMLGLAANVAAMAIENARLVADLRRSNNDLLQAYDSTLEGWSRALDLRDQETQGHSQRVTDLTVRLARAAGMSDEQVSYVRWGALLHDIGKVGIPDSILLKPGPLNDAEWHIMRQHPVYAYNLLAPIKFLRPALDIPYCHHERWAGGGYPRNLSGEEIPLAARLFAVIDIWDALRSDRPYRPALSVEQVRAHLQSLAGNHLDPAAVALFFQVIDEVGIVHVDKR